jgi:hypothetical protein
MVHPSLKVRGDATLTFAGVQYFEFGQGWGSGNPHEIQDPLRKYASNPLLGENPSVTIATIGHNQMRA